MLFVVKLFPEITIKSRPVRRRLIRTLRRNLRNVLADLDPQVAVSGEWDCIDVETDSSDDIVLRQIVQKLKYTPGIAHFQVVEEYPLPDFDEIAQLCKTCYQDELVGKTFVVRCKRSGKHDFTSVDVERFVGGILLHQTEAAGVKLKNPELTVNLEIRHQFLYLVKKQYQGLGGFPLGTQEGVLSLISGGFDSAVSSFLCIKRGLVTHYCFFNLGGRAHEIAVKEVALFLWMKYGSSHRVKFVTVPFEGVVNEILTRVDDSQMGVVLKRMMLRAAEQIAAKLKIQALVTGESIAQVSSQTLPNLAAIDSVTNTLVLRPLITSNKQDIIDLARKIGTEDFSKNIPEYCGVISVKPTTRAKLWRVEKEESHFDLTLIEQAVADARIQNITEITDDLSAQVPDLRVATSLNADDTVIDIRHPDEREFSPLRIDAATEVEKLDIPFFQLQSYFSDQDRSRAFLLYCDKGMMSRLHAAHLQDQGFTSVGVYAPARE